MYWDINATQISSSEQKIWGSDKFSDSNIK